MKKEYLLLVSGVAFLTLITLLSLLLADQFEVSTCGCPKMVSHNFVMIFIFLSIVFVSCLLYYLYSIKIDNKEKIINNNIKTLYSILDSDEEALIKNIVSNGGVIEQAKISKNYGKLKSHRLVKKLEEKNIIIIIKEGKTNRIELKKELKQGLIK
jgi:hypothetical protein